MTLAMSSRRSRPLVSLDVFLQRAAPETAGKVSVVDGRFRSL